MRDLIDAARTYYIERDSAMAEIERLLSLEDEELREPDADTEQDIAGGFSDERKESIIKEL